MNLSSPQTAWRLILAVSAILLVGIVGYSIFSVVRALREPDQARATVPTPALAAAAHLPDTPPAEAAPAPTENDQDVTAEFEAIRQREQGRKALIENLRQQARENPDDPGTLSKERIDALEKSGDSLM